MNTLPKILAAAIAAAFASCQQTPTPAHYNGNGELAPAAAGDPLSAPQAAATTPAPAPVETPAPQSTPKIKRNPGSYPLAVATPEAGIVLSPYKPYNKVRVTKFKSGDIVEDPDNRGKIFRIP